MQLWEREMTALEQKFLKKVVSITIYKASSMTGSRRGLSTLLKANAIDPFQDYCSMRIVSDWHVDRR